MENLLQFDSMIPPPPSAISARMARLATRRWATVLLVAVLLSGASATVLRSLKIRANLFALLPPTMPSMKNLQRIYDQTGGFGDLVVLAEGGSQEAAERYFADLLPAIEKLKWTRGADYRVDLDKLRPYAALYMDVADLKTIHHRLQRRLETAVGANLELDDDEPPPKLRFDDITRKYEKRAEQRKHPFASADGKIRALRIYPPGQPTSNLVFGRRAVRDIERLVAQRKELARELGLKISVGGKFWNRVQDYHSVIDDLTRSAFWGGALIVLLLTLYFRHLLAVPLLILPLGMSMSWTFAITKLTIGDLNVITAFLFVILLGLGIDFGIHLFARYRAERLAGRQQQEALAVTLATTGRACRTAAITTAAAFASLLVTDFRGFSQFGFIAAIGVTLAFLSMSIVLPALIVACERIRLLRFKRRSEGDQPARASVSVPPPTNGTRRALGLAAVVAMALALGGGVAAGTGRIGFEYDFEKLNTLPPDVIRVKDKVTRVFGRATDAAVVFVDDLEEAEALTRVVKAHMARDESPTIEQVVSLNDMVPDNQAEKLEWIAKIRRLLDKRAVQKAVAELPEKQRERVQDFQRDTVSRPMTHQELPRQLRRPFLGQPGVQGTLVAIYPTRPPRDAQYAAQFVADTREFKTEKRTYRPSSEAVIFAEVIRVLKEDGRIAICATLLTVLVLLLIDFRRPGHTLLAFLPLAAAVGWLLLTMATWPVDLNMYNLVVLPSLIGLGIDNSVHLTHRYLELGPGRMGAVLRSILGPIAVSTMTTMIGFGGMMAAHQDGLQSLGVLAVLGMGLSLLAVSTFLPALLLYLEGRRAEATEVAAERSQA